ncbi:MAG: aminopeptidase [Lachnospiraceae bacterium]|nr:aminopeptidase [Lachnospiraceae bacterium]
MKDMELETLNERYDLVIERIFQIVKEENVRSEYRAYFQTTAKFLIKVDETLRMAEDGFLDTESLEDARRRNRDFYQDILEENYGTSYANPAYAVSELGEKFGGILSFLYTDLRSCIGLAYEGRRDWIAIFLELFVEIYNAFETTGEVDKREIEQTIYWFYHDYSEIFVERNVQEIVDPSLDFFTKIVMEADLSDVRYLYRYGEYISDCEVEIAKFLGEMEEEKIQSMADTYTEGYRIGFVNLGVDLSKKETVQIHYPIGFERMVRVAIKNFEKMGLRPTIARDPSLSLFNRGHGKGNVYTKAVNKQYEYDHKDDKAYYLDKAFVERRLEVLRNSFEKRKELAAVHAGPAVIEIFGEKPFEPENKKENARYSEKQQQLNVYYANQAGQITNAYIKGDERSFTVIAYPIPAIGEQFREIFAETVKINTLDYKLYQTMQQKIIDVLDSGEKVHIQGSGDNKTDLTVMLYRLKDPEKETIFENCVADVNIPVGEVFTSPVLKGTTGKLHVSQVYLSELNFLDLEIDFRDGMIVDYTCKNFETEEENRKYIRENVLMHHDTLPMGEFAIGTNTTAYRMARKYDIAAKLPILIAEKTGPHFAVGDTCYSHAEENAVFNPNGKEIVARDNEVSILRKEDQGKAYLNCHTDITIPYDELGAITVIRANGTIEDIIRDGRFVVAGCEVLNEPLDHE